MTRRLRTYVHVHGDDGQTAVFGPDDDIPLSIAAKITNPDVWADKPSALAPEPPGVSGMPPKRGPGSGATAWREYASSKGVEVPADAPRDDVIAALDKAGVPTE